MILGVVVVDRSSKMVQNVLNVSLAWDVWLNRSVAKSSDAKCDRPGFAPVLLLLPAV